MVEGRREIGEGAAAMGMRHERIERCWQCDVPEPTVCTNAQHRQVLFTLSARWHVFDDEVTS